MKIVFATTLSLRGSTIIGRVIPLAEQLAKHHHVHVLVLDQSPKTHSSLQLHSVGQEPFTRTTQEKIRLSGLPLVLHLFMVAVRTTLQLFKLKPDAVIIVKPLPHNVLGVWFWSLFNKDKTVILDVDDFELSANVLTSLTQRGAIHWAERVGANLATIIVTASPFLKDHFEQLTQNKKKVVMIPTGIHAAQPEGSEGGEFSRSRRGRQASDSERGISDEKIAAPRSQSTSLLYIGSLSISSGHRIDLLPDILQELLKTFPHIQLHIAGDGDDTAKLKNQFAKQGLKQHVHWHGRFTISEVERLLRQAPILLDPIDASIPNRAKSSFRTLLAASNGLPIVTSDIGIRPYQLPQLLHLKFFASPANPKDYAAKIMSLLNHPLTPDEQSALRLNSSQFTWHNLSNKYIKLLHT